MIMWRPGEPLPPFPLVNACGDEPGAGHARQLHQTNEQINRPFLRFQSSVGKKRRFCGFVESYFVLIVIRFPSFEKLAVPYSATESRFRKHGKFLANTKRSDSQNKSAAAATTNDVKNLR